MDAATLALKGKLPAGLCLIIIGTEGIATNLLRKAPGKGSMLMKSHKAAWDDDFRASVFRHANAA